MKNFIIAFLMSYTCLAQVQVISVQKYDLINNVGVIDTTSTINLASNMVDETAYFNATLVPVASKDSLQWYLDTYNHVRLEAGSYGFDSTPQAINIGSNQSIYGHPEITLTPTINVLAGSSNVHLENIRALYVNFNAGAPITNSVFKGIKWSTLRSTGAMIENNLFVNLNSTMDFDMSVSGYYRNNTIIRHQVHGSLALRLLGNNTTPSTGNVNVWSNYLTPDGDGGILENMGDITFIGLDSEGWNLRNESTYGAMFYASEMGTVKMSDFIGGGNYSTDGKPAWLIEADKLLFFNKNIWSQSDTVQNTAQSGTNVVSLYNRGAYDVVSGTDIRIHTGSQEATYPLYNVNISGVDQIATITDTTTINSIKEVILDTQYTPYERPTYENLPNPLGANWATNRIGKPDSTAYIQALIDNDTIAQLPEGVFYISSTLNLDGKAGLNEGIVGSGTGKTVICGLTDDFPLVTVSDSNAIETKITLANLTLQGGNVGLYVNTAVRLMAYNIWKYVIFRNQSIGIHIEEIFGFDNNNLDHLSFIDCGIGFWNDYAPSAPSGTPEYDTWLNYDLGYVDKSVFYKSQFINCDIGASVKSVRASNLNLWQDCIFDGNRLALDIVGQRNSMIVNCDFTNNTGDQYESIIRAGDISIYSCNFYNNTTNNVCDVRNLVAEGCNFLDASTVARPDTHFDQNHYIYNCTSNGDFGGGWRYQYAAIVNSTFAGNPEYNKLIVNINQNVVTTIIDEPSNPYPQFFVKHTLNNQ